MQSDNGKPNAILIKKTTNDEIRRIEDLVQTIKFGSLTIHVEDGKIIQVDKNEKIRFR